MQLGEWLKEVEYTASPTLTPSMTLSGELRLDHRRVQPGDIFVALPGEQSHGSEYAEEAWKRGASLIVSDMGPKNADLPWVTIPALPLLLLPLTQRYYPVEWERIYTVAVTGTNGKSSIVSMIRQIMAKLGYAAAVTGTVEVEGPGYREEPWQTTPHFLELYRLLYRWQKNASGKIFYAYEASSHALAQHRLAGIPADAAIITAITHDHLDYHKDYAAYLETKLRLVHQPIIHTPGVLVYDGALNPPPTPRLSYAVGKGKEVEVIELNPERDKVTGRIRIGSECIEVVMDVMGGFQMVNAAYALASLHLLFGFSLKLLSRSLSDFVPPPGRMERVILYPFTVVVDYAHTPHGLETVLKELRLLNPKKLRVVFGCGGDRDPGKRPEMGRIAANLADSVIVTSDNPRSEPPEKIIAEIIAGIPPSLKEKVEQECDRRKAIARALSLAEDGDIILIAGKGHERVQVFADKAIPFSDVEEVKRCLNL